MKEPTQKLRNKNEKKRTKKDVKIFLKALEKEQCYSCCKRNIRETLEWIYGDLR